MQRLVGLPHIVRGEASGHRFDALAFPFQQQSRAVVLKRNNSVSMPRGLRQAIEVGRKAFLLGAWRAGPFSHKTILTQNVLFITQ
jgi:hypothetical protein